MNNKKSNLLVFTVILIIWIFCITFLIDIDDLECTKRNDVCTVYTRKVFSKSHIKDTFRISDIESFFIRRGRSGSRHSHSYYYPVLITKNKKIYLNGFSSSSGNKAEKIIERIMDDRDFEIKGTYFKTILRLYP